MSLGRGESVGLWFERAIVARSLAATEQESLLDVGNDIARRVTRQRVEEASADLDRALSALQAERQFTRQGRDAVIVRTGH